MLAGFFEKVWYGCGRNVFRELTQEEAREMSRRDGYDLGIEEGRTEGEACKALEMARAMKEDNKPVDEISKYTGLSIEEIEKL